MYWNDEINKITFYYTMMMSIIDQVLSKHKFLSNNSVLVNIDYFINIDTFTSLSKVV